MKRVSLLIATLIAFAAVLFGMAETAAAQDVVNIARLDVRLGGIARQIDSNSVTATRILAPTPATVNFLRAVPNGSSGVIMPSSGGQCRNAVGMFNTIPAPSVPIQTASETQVYHAGDDILISLKDDNRNIDRTAVETIDLRATTSTGDAEVLRLKETGPNTGLFATTIPSVAQPPAPTQYDCRLSVASGVVITANYADVFYPADLATDSVTIDPVEYVFDSETGALLNGAAITLIDNATGQPARVFGDDGTSSFPSTITSGATVSDGAGRIYSFPEGGFRFPVVAPGSYRFVVVPPAGYTGPSQVAVADLVKLLNPSGDHYTIDESGSFLRIFTINGAVLFRIDIPLDRQRLALLVRKEASVAEASAGDYIQYRLSVENRNATAATNATALLDKMAGGLRYQAGSLKVNGVRAADPVIDASGSGLRMELGTIAAGATVEVTYVVLVTPATALGDAVNRVHAVANGAPASNEARAAVRIRPLLMSDAATIIGRVFDGNCGVDAKVKPGLANVRLLMEDGSFVLSDRDGLFHFEGVRPGVHVVQLDVASMPAGYEALSCIQNTRHGGRAFSQFVDVRGGALWRTDFHVRRVTGAVSASAAAVIPAVTEAAEAAAAAGARSDWLTGQDAGNAFLFPTGTHNPRSPTVRIVVKHVAGSTVRLTANGVAIGALAYDGTDQSADKAVQVSKWRGIELVDGDNRLVAEVLDGAGRTIATLTQVVHYANVVAHAEIVPARSRLVADGRTPAVIAVRFTDRAGRPVRSGVTGIFRLSAPYRPLSDVALEQARQLAGAERTRPTYRVTGDDGIALIELAPTAQAGSIELDFTHEVDRRRVEEKVRGWMQPGDQPFVVVGFAAGTIGFDTLTEHVARLEGPGAATKFRDGQISFFAKGRVLGKWLLTMAYDSDKKTGRDARRPLGGTIDPQRYYDVYADGTEQGYDAATTKKLYLRLERSHFYALFGDFETGMTQSELARYSRNFTGVKSEYQTDKVALKAFAAKTSFRYAKDELQGSGLSGPYRLSRRGIVLNSDKLRIETRDRFRSDRIVETRLLARHIDYDVDYDAGTLRFRQPVLSRDRDFNPIFIVVDYEIDGAGTTTLNAGGRASAKLAGGKVEVGASLIHEEDVSATTDLVGVDATITLAPTTEVRLEAAASRTTAGGEKREGTAYLAEIEHRGTKVDALAYYRQQDANFGTGQLNRAESGTRKYGVDARFKATDTLSLSTSAWREEALAGHTSREALRAQAEYRSGGTSLRAGTQMARDHVPSGETLVSQQVTAGVSQTLLDNRLTLDADAAIGLGGSSDSLDFPDRYRVGAAFALRPDVRLIASHEITRGNGVDAATTSVGFDVAPWRGGHLASSVNQQDMRENGTRSYALYGLSQSVILSPRWSIDATLDGSRTLSGEIRQVRIVNPNHPVASGGYLGNGTTLAEDFWAVTGGATYRSKSLSWTGRAEYRRGDIDTRVGVTTALLRQTKAGISMAASASFDRAEQAKGTTATRAVANASVAWRPLGSHWALLDKLEMRWDEMAGGTGSTETLLGADGLGVVGDARSRRIINNFALNYVGATAGNSDEADGGDAYEHAQLSLYYGSKYVLDRFGDQDFSGYTHMLGVEGRIDVTDRLDIGFNAAVRHSLSSGTINTVFGASIGISPVTNSWVSLGYNWAGFSERDFDDNRYTRQGFYLKLRFKFDQDTPADLFGRASRK